MKKTIVIAGLALTLTACAGIQAQKTADETITQAVKEVAAAKKAGIWNNTEKFLEDAIKLQDNLQFEEAGKLAKMALSEAKLAQKQAAAEAPKGKPHFSN